MTAVNAIINVDINTAQAQAQLQKLAGQVNAFNRTLATSSTAASRMAQDFNSKSIGRAFTAQMVPVVDSVTQFSTSLEKNKLSLGEYTRYAASQLPGMSKVFRREFDTMNRVAESRVKQMQSQYMALGKTAQGVQMAMQMTPTGLGKGYATNMALATQKAQIFNKVIDNGATKMLNWGKNTQWAGRQLMVGFSLPLMALGAVAAKTFIELDKAATAFKRVYGDLGTTTEAMNTNLQAMKDLGAEYTKYGIAVKDTLALSARVAATGAQNQDLMAMTEETLRLATLGQMDYNDALNATISMQTAFKINSEDLGSTVDYLNAVENQTVLTIQDMAAAIPRVAPVIKGLGGDVKDLAAMLTAMREGGVTAEQGANALKSGLASLINPTAKAQAALQNLGINMKEIITQNRGDLLGTVQAFGKALAVVDEFSQQQALEQIFGKYQYARMGALFKNIASDAGQAAKAIDLAGKSTEELAMLSERELGKVEQATSVKFAASMEKLKLAIAPLGEAFLKGIMPLMNGITKIAEMFNNLPDGVKNAMALVTGLVAGLGPVLLMTLGLIGNGMANLTKMIQSIRKAFAWLKGDASKFGYLAQAEHTAVAASEALDGSTRSLTSSMMLQAEAVALLTEQYSFYARAASLAGIAARGAMVSPMGMKGARPTGMAKGGTVPGSGSGDTIPALLTPGESVVTKKATQKYAPIIQSMNEGTLPGFAFGFNPFAFRGRAQTMSGVRELLTGGTQYGGFKKKPLVSGFSLEARRDAPSSFDLLKRAFGADKPVDMSILKTAYEAGGGTWSSDVEAKMLAGRKNSVSVSHIAKTANHPKGGKPWTLKNTAWTTVAENNAFEEIFKSNTHRDIATGAMGRFDSRRRKQITGFLDGKHPSTRSEYDTMHRLLSMMGADPAFKPERMDDLFLLKGFMGNRVGARQKGDPFGIFSGTPKSLDLITKPLLQGFADGVTGIASSDTIPALLTPGESVVTRDATRKYGPIIAAMNSGRLPGFEGGVVGDRYIDQHGKPVRGHMGDMGYISDEVLAALQEEERLKPKPNQNVLNATKAKALNNMIMAIPQAGNRGRMTGTEWSHAFSDVDVRAQMINPLVTAISQEMDLTPEQIKANPQMMKSLNVMSDTMGTELGRAGAAIIEDPHLFAATEKGIAAASAHMPPEMATAVEKAQQRITGLALYGPQDGTTKMLGRIAREADQPILNQRPGMKTVTPYKGLSVTGAGNPEGYWDRIRTDAGDDMRRRREEQTAEAKARYEARKGSQSVTARANPVPVQAVDTGQHTLPPVAAAPQTASRISPKEEYKTLESELRRLDRIDRELQQQKNLIPSRRQQMLNEARTAPIAGGGDTRSLRKTRELAVRAMSDDEILRIIQQEEADRVAQERQSSRQRQQTRVEGTRAVQKEQTRQQRAAQRSLGSQGQIMAEPGVSTPWSPSSLGRNWAQDEAPATPQSKRAGLFRRGTSIDGQRTPSFIGRQMKALGAVRPGMAMGIGMMSMVPMMMQDQNGKFMGQDAGTMSMGMGLASMVAMLPGPIAAVAAAAGAGALAIKIWRNNVDESARAAAKFGSEIGGTANALNGIGSILGKQTPAQKQAQMNMGVTADQAASMYGDYGQYLQGEKGTAFLDQLKGLTSPERLTVLSDYLKNAIATGMLSISEAQDFGQTVALSIGDGLLGLRVVKDIQGQAAGLAGMKDIANTRLKAVESSAGIIAVKNATGPISSDAASAALGSSMQVIQDFGNVASMAREEYAKGTITYSQMIEAVNSSRDAQVKYTQYIEDALNKSADRGATEQAYKQELIRTGKVTEEQLNAAADAFATASDDAFNAQVKREALAREASGALPDPSTIMGGGGAGGHGGDMAFRGAADYRARMDVLYNSLLETMAPPDAQTLAASVFTDVDLNKVYADLISKNFSSVDAAQIALQVVDQVKTIEDEIKGAIAGATVRANQQGMDAKDKAGYVAGVGARTRAMLEAQRIPIADYTKAGGTPSSWQAFQAALPAGSSQSVMNNFAKMTGQQIYTGVGDFQTLNASLGDNQHAANLVNSQEYLARAARGTTQPMVQSVQKGKDFFRDNYAGIEDYITGVSSQKQSDDMEKNAQLLADVNKNTPDKVVKTLEIKTDIDTDITDKIPLFIKYATELQDKVPDDVLKTLNIDINSPIDLEKFGDSADGLARIAGIIQGMPADQKMFSAELAFKMVNGKQVVKSPKEFMNDTRSFMKELSKIEKTKDINVRKTLMFTLISNTMDENGVEISPDEVKAKYDNLVSEFGKQNIENLPPDIITKAILVDINGDQLVQAGMALANASGDLFAAGFVDEAKAMEHQAGLLIDAGAKLKTQASMGVQQAIGQHSVPTGSSGGGNEHKAGAAKDTTLKDFKAAIDDKLRLYVNLTNMAKKLKKYKGNFEKAYADTVHSGSFVDKLRGMGLTESFIANLISQGYKPAKKIVDALKKQGLINWNAKFTAGSGKEIVSNYKTEANLAVTRRKAKRMLTGTAGLSAEDINTIISNDAEVEYLASIKKGGKAWREYIKWVKKAIAARKEFEDAATTNEAYDKNVAIVDLALQVEQIRVRNELDAEFLDTNGMTQKAMQRKIDANEELIAQQKKLSDAKQEEINDIQHTNDLTQQHIDDLNRISEINNREADAISHELDIMGQVEAKIQEAYDKRIKALEEVAKINEHISQQNRDQLDLAQALSQGDIGRAAQVSQQIQATDAQFAMDQMKAGLDQGKENSIAGLRTEGGLTRDQAEARVAAIKEQVYQMSLLIRNEEDKIYQNNLKIRDLNNQIYTINENTIEPLTNQNAIWSDIVSKQEKKLRYAQEDLMVAGMTLQQWEDQKIAMDAAISAADQLGSKWKDIFAAAQAAAAAALEFAKNSGNKSVLDATGLTNTDTTGLPKGTVFAPNGVGYANGPDAPYYSTSPTGAPIFNYGAKRFAGGIMKYGAGSVVGDGGRDSVHAMVTPGEFIIRKAMVDKYGIPMLSSINQGAFSMPKYKVAGLSSAPSATAPAHSVTTNSPVYNTYSVNVHAPQANVTADEIVNKVFTKFEQIDNANIRSVRGR